MIALCRRAGLDVIQADLLKAFERIAGRFDSNDHGSPYSRTPSGSDYARCSAALRHGSEAGGLAVFETPNPENLGVGAQYRPHTPKAASISNASLSSRSARVDPSSDLPFQPGALRRGVIAEV